MGVHIQEIQSTDAWHWDAYLHSHPHATLYHLYGWRNVIEKTYGHKTYYLFATNPIASVNPTNSNNSLNTKTPVVGLLPLVHLKHFLFGNSLISMPFFDLGGILADGEETEQALLNHAIQLGRKLKATTIELRHAQPISCLNSTNPLNPICSTNRSNPTNSINSSNSNNPTNPFHVVTRSHKVRMLLDLPDSSETLMKSYKSKLRSQIRKPIKDGLVARIGGLELLQDFYHVFSVNMRDLGSPVHPSRLIQNVLREFPEDSRLITIYRANRPVACSLIMGFKDTLENPWASSLRQYSRLSPNMLLYWSMLAYACDNGFTRFDFGRSTPGEGTYRFKKQWGAQPYPLHWHFIFLNGHRPADAPDDKSRFESLVRYWQKLPVPVTRLIGPLIRKHIGL